MQPGSLWQPTPSSGGKILLFAILGSLAFHGVLFLLRLPEPRPPELPDRQKLVMIQPAPKARPKPKVEPEPPKPKKPTLTKKPVLKTQPQKAMASRKILSSKATTSADSTVSENQVEGSRGTGYGTGVGDDNGSTSPVGVDKGGGAPEPAPPPPPPPPPPLVNAKPKGAVQPNYPEIAQQNNWEGRVIVKAYINADGSVGDVQVAKSSGHSELDDAALEAVKRTRFEPARRGEETVAAWVRIPVTFSLQ